MLERLLEIGASFDWITPLASVLGDLMNGPSHTFLIPYGSSPLSGREIGWMLGKRGVKCWGLMVVSGTLMVSVRLGQARWAQHLLEQAGVPIENPVPGQSTSQRGDEKRSAAQPGSRTQAAGRKGELGTLADSISELLNTRLF
ncbi:MAG: hypothetical protein ACK2U2_10470 [Anaerolineae bacterium]|jgi:hypothetical protein